ncbi:PTS fructose transporter subunit IIBC [Selenomonas noxia]|jgi:PTS system, fru family, IIC component|uniref:PTS fructose transporter subunit IIC n=1 Tax=Selenomonas noxia TaxID=135083 RepID=UPI0028D0673F|nr:PTS fructose transporter subunit IIBC [Selenomonas noxia]
MKIVGISACTAGIAHTYMAQEALEQECKKRGIDCKIETQGGMGIDNELSQEEIDAADVVILAVAVSVEMSERFDSKRAAGRVLDVTPGDAIKKTAELIDRAESIAASSAPEAVQTKSSAARSARSASEEKTSLGAELFRYFNTGISYFLPVIIAGGMLFSFTLITGTVEDGRIIPSSQFWQNVYDLGMAGFSMMVPVLCAYIAYAIGSKAAIAPGFILGHAANTPMGESHIATGFLGALLLGFLVGYFVRWLKKFPVPDVLQPMMPTFLIPLFTTLILGLFYIYLLTVPLNAFVQFMIQVMYQLNGAGAMALGIGIGLLAAADFGGACSKAATAFTLALMAEGILGPNGVFRMCCAIPPLGMGLAAFILRSRYDAADRQLGISALFLSSAGITEGAIPFAGKDFRRTWIACAIGTSIAGAVGMLHGITSIVAFGGVVAITGVVDGKLWYVLDMLLGAGIIVLILFFTKPKLEEAKE